MQGCNLLLGTFCFLFLSMLLHEVLPLFSAPLCCVSSLPITHRSVKNLVKVQGKPYQPLFVYQNNHFKNVQNPKYNTLLEQLLWNIIFFQKQMFFLLQNAISKYIYTLEQLFHNRKNSFQKNYSKIGFFLLWNNNYGIQTLLEQLFQI